MSGGVIKKYGYFVRTWQGSINNMQVSNSGGWDLSYIKCKFYADTWDVYWFFSDTSIEIASNTFTSSNGDSLAEVGISSPINKFYDQDYRITDGTDT